MQISSTILTQNQLIFQARRGNFACRGSPLNPVTKPKPTCSTRTLNPAPASSTEANQLIHYDSEEKPTESIQTHLSNLEKLLQKNVSPPPLSGPQPLHHDSGGNESPENKEEKKGLFEGLKLARLWSLEFKAGVEEMSPRHMNRLQRLLSKSQEYSPRNNLGSQWREYHGSNDWAGLLDPLDDNLRREVVRYGEFVQAAYHSFHLNPATSADEAPLPNHVALPDTSYKVTKSLYATASIGLPSWVDDVAPDLGWMTQRSSWIGYVAVCDDNREIARMGRRDIVIALRGTATCLEWAENIRDLLVRVPGDNDSDHGQPKVQCGFLSLYKTCGAHVPSLSESVMDEIRRLMELYKGETLSITITGHSLGAAIALLAADELSTSILDAPPIAVISFGGPRVGNRCFANHISKNGVKVLRIVNSQDVITRVPGMFVSEGLDHKLRETNVIGGVLNVLDNNMPWAYSHVGTELRVDSKMSPYLKPNADVACCHDLEAYLHLVDGFLASNCPFRDNAKRSLAKLLHEQGSNVKKLYISKGKSLLLNLDKGGVTNPSCLPSPS